ncbi:MAG: DUF6600 domain-containing protein [Verrucomicrobiota bacterium]
MRIKNFIAGKSRIFNIWAAAVVAWAVLMAGTVGHAQTPAATVSQDLQEIVKFTQAHMTDEVIVAYIKNSGKSYTLSADDMLYLNSQGVSQTVLSALLAAKPTTAAAPAPTPATPAPAPVPATPAPAPVAAPAPAPLVAVPSPAPAPGLIDNFGLEGGLNPAVWTTASGVLASLAAVHGSAWISPYLAFRPAGMQMSGVNGMGQFTGIQSVAGYVAPFSMTATVSGLSEQAIPFEIYLVSADLRQWLSVAGHLGGAGSREGELRLRGGLPGFRGGMDIPLGERRSPDHGVWVNYTGSALPLAALGIKLYEEPHAGVPYTIQMTVGADGMASVILLNPEGSALGARVGLPVGSGPFNVVLASRNGATSANWNSVQLTPLAPPVAIIPAVAPQTPTLDYFQAQLGPYGQWMEVPGIGPAWVPAAASDPLWRPYVDAGHWEYTDAGWYWQSDYPWGEIAFHYGRWIKDARTGFAWAWAPAYDWAPAWVAWRYAEADGCMGWAPLPWEARYEAGLGLTFGGRVAVDIDFGLGVDAFVFVGRDHFWEHDYHAYVLDREHTRVFYGRSEIHNGYRMDHGRFVAEGLGRERMAAFTHHEVVARQAHELRQAEEHHNLEVRREEHARAAARPEERAKERPAEHGPVAHAPETRSTSPGETHPGAAVPGSKQAPSASKQTGKDNKDKKDNKDNKSSNEK